jgi:hypothetical protein
MGIDKLDAARRLQVPEVWFWKKGAFLFMGLEQRAISK